MTNSAEIHRLLSEARDLDQRAEGLRRQAELLREEARREIGKGILSERKRLTFIKRRLDREIDRPT